jgi:chaperone BCS1
MLGDHPVAPYFLFSNNESSVKSRNNDVLKRLVLEAKREYERDGEHRVHIFTADA